MHRPLGTSFCFEQSVVCSLYKLDFDKPAFGKLDGSEILDGKAIGVVSTLVVDETGYGLEIMDVLVGWVHLLCRFTLGQLLR